MIKRKREEEDTSPSDSDWNLRNDSGDGEGRLLKARRTSAQEHPVNGFGDVSSGSRSESLPAAAQADQAGSEEALENGLGNHKWNRLSRIRPGQLAFPRSAYEGYRHPLPLVSESTALQDLKPLIAQQRQRAAEQQTAGERTAEQQTTDTSPWNFILLESFSAYRSSAEVRRADELAGLETVETHRGAQDGLRFDGILRVGQTRRYVQGVPFKVVTVEGYGDENVTDLSHRICLQSKHAGDADVWYQLGRPSKEYARFYEPFLWLAEFTKHFVDYLLELPKATLDDFRIHFYNWLTARHGDDLHFRQWWRQSHLRDFRTTVAAHCNYLWKECAGVDKTLSKHPIWSEVHHLMLDAIKEQPIEELKTVVTPLVYDIFEQMYFSNQFRAPAATDPQIIQKVNAKKAELGLTVWSSRGRGRGRTVPAHRSPTDVSVGDVVVLDADLDSEWKSDSRFWYALVQDVRRHNKTGRTVLDVLWLYEPRDTTIGAATYPFENELFLSDNCSCGQDAIDARDVRGKVDVVWFAKDPTAETGYFVRQKFRTAHDTDEGTDDFVSLCPTDFKCACSERQLSDFEYCRRKHKIGDTVLFKNSVASFGNSAAAADSTRLDPAIILDFDLRTKKVVLRQLWKTSEMSNELVLTDVIVTRPAGHLVRSCNVRFLKDTVSIPTGYNRGGAGDFYYIVDVDNAEYPMTEGLDLEGPPPFKKLVGMGIFCGGGNFDRGLEEGGAVDFQYAIDLAPHALYTYRANSKAHCFLGSVNDYLLRAMKGDEASVIIAMPGDIEVISAGSPCPGFSNLQSNKWSEQSLCNASMVASVVSYVDFFCPKYCILENVVAMASPIRGDKRQNVFAQIIGAFVAMGYQVQQFLEDAWSHGSPQSRSRVFIVASAPGIEPFPLPRISHDHPRAGFPLQALGRASNGRTFGKRRDEYTPFRCMTAADAVSDLPYLGDGQSRVCPAFPDHSVPWNQDAAVRERIACVPFRPYGQGLWEAAQQGVLGKKHREWFSRTWSMKKNRPGKSFSRVRPDRLFPIVTTAQRLACHITGQTLHWNENRPLTVMELRRAMGFPDEEPIIGSPSERLRIIGNSVDRKVAFALGLCLRESWSITSASTEDGAGVVEESEVLVDEQR